MAVWREPFRLGTPDVELWRPGLSVADIVSQSRCLPAGFAANGVVAINGETIPRAMWPFARPKPTSEHRLVTVTFHQPLQGGGGGGGGRGKGILGIVAALALTVFTAGIAGGLLAPILGAGFAAGTLGASLLAAGVGIVGSLVVAGLSSPPVRSATDDRGGSGGGRDLEPAGITGNVLEPNAPIPRVIGTRRVYPPFAFEPIIELVGQDEYVEAVYCLAGPHRLENFRLGDTTVSPDDLDGDLVMETRTGLPGDTRLTIPRRQGRTFEHNTDMSVHGTDAEDLSAFASPLPVWHGVATAEAPDEAWIHLLLSGLVRQEDFEQSLRIPIRLRIRRRGDEEWRYLPELHYRDQTQAQRRLQIKFVFGAAFEGTLTNPPLTRGWIEARKLVPGQDVSPLGEDFEADPYFSAGAGDDIYRFGTNETTNVRNLLLAPDVVIVHLSAEEFPPGVYDIELKRGATFRDDQFVSDTYRLSGDVRDFFGITADNLLPLSREGLLDRMVIRRIVSIRNRYPIVQKNLALIAIRTRNQSVARLSVRASGYVRDGAELVTTSNPAVHYRDILTGSLNFDPLPQDLVDEAGLAEWREDCDLAGHACDMVAEGTAMADLLRIVAACGYARPYQSERWGVIRDYDRSAEAPVQVFSPRNSAGFRWRKAFPRLPAGLRVNYRDEERDYSEKQIVVYRAGAEGTDARTEQVTYEGFVDADRIAARARFDLAQAQHRGTFYSLDVPAEAIVCRRGSLVALSHDVLARHTGHGRIVEVTIDDEDVIGVVLDGPIELKNAPDLLAVEDMLAVDDMLEIGLRSAIAIRRTDGATSVHLLANAAGESAELEFAEPVAVETAAGGPFDDGDVSAIAEGCLVVAGIHGREYRRLIVSEIRSGRDLAASLTLVDEAPQIWST